MMGLAVAITGIPGGDLTATENATNLRVLRFSSDSSLGTLYPRDYKADGPDPADPE